MSMDSDRLNIKSRPKTPTATFEDLTKDLDSTATLEMRKVYLTRRVRQYRRLGYGLIALASVILFFAIIRAIFPTLTPIGNNNFLPEYSLTDSAIFTVIALYLAGGGALLAFVAPNRHSTEIELIDAKQRIQNQLQGSPRHDNQEVPYFSRLVEINVVNLSEYYALVKVHTNNSFRISLAAGILGFSFVIFGLLIGLNSTEATRFVAIVATAAGVVTNFIAGVFFYLYNRTVQQLKNYHDSLLNVQNVLLSFKIIDDLKEDTQKAAMATSMLAHLIGKQHIQASSSASTSQLDS